MKLFLLFPFLFLFSCTSQTPAPTNTNTALPAEKSLENPTSGETGILGYCWRGRLEGNIPVQLQYQVDGDVVTGSIQYLATTNQSPIKLIGTVENNEFRLLEFAPGGNITGIITGKREGKMLTGDWFSPATRKTRNLNLSQIDTTIPTNSIAVLPAETGGSYRYSYGKEGPQGTLSLKPLAGGKALLKISAATGAPAFNMADIGADTVTLEGDRIVYRFADAPECSFQVRIYKGFALVNYLTNGGCTSQFGHNATVEGIFLKNEK